MATARNNRKMSATAQRAAALLVEATEMPDMQDTLAELLRTHGWQCSPPAQEQPERRS